MKRLELNCTFFQISAPYKEETVLWDGQVELKIGQEEGNIVGYFRAWKDNVEPERIKVEGEKLEEKAKSLALGLKFIGNRQVYWEKSSLDYYFQSEKITIRNDVDIEAVIKRSKGEPFNYIYAEIPMREMTMTVSVSQLPLPLQMPNIPLSLERYILTIIQAEELDGYEQNYEDEQLKRWFLILEELETDKSTNDYKEIKVMRNLVSHSKCDHLKPEEIEFLEKELPCSVYINPPDKKEARFDRANNLHIALVSKYQNKARRRARDLVKQEIEEHDGNVN